MNTYNKDMQKAAIKASISWLKMRAEYYRTIKYPEIAWAFDELEKVLERKNSEIVT